MTGGWMTRRGTRASGSGATASAAPTSLALTLTMAVALTLTLALAVSGCSGGSGDSAMSSADSSGGAAPVAADSGATAGSDEAAAATGAAAGATGAVAKSAPAAAPREIVSTATMTVVAKDVSGVSADAEAAVAAKGGFVFGEEAGGRRGSAVLTLKVPAPEFRPLLTALARLGKVEGRTVTTDDVTAQGADLDARIVSAQRSVDRVRAFLDEAKNVGELSSVEAELTRRETELEQLQGQRRVLNDQVALATVTLTISPTPAPAPPAEDGLRAVPGFGGALASGWGALVKVGRVVAAGAGYALPFVAVVAVPLALFRLRRRRSVGSAILTSAGE